MDIDSFIAKYGPEWKRLDEACARGGPGLAKLSGPQISEVLRLYLRTAGHLAEAQSRYGDPSLRSYLNSVVTRAYSAIYAGRPRTVKGALKFFGARYREAIRRTVPFILAMAALLVVVAGVTSIWVANSREAQAGLLPPFAREAIRRAGGHRADLGVPPAGLSTLILVNNVVVAFLAFALGIGLGVGTILLVTQNAVLIGALAGAYQAAGKAGVFWSLVLPHGLLEITAICIAAGAGLRMGWSVIAPGDRLRGRAVAEESRDAVVVVTGAIPAFGVAALIEGFVTGTSIPASVQLGLGVAVVVAYLAFLFGRPRPSPAGR